MYHHFGGGDWCRYMAVPETMRTNEDRMVVSISCQRIHAESGEVVSSQAFPTRKDGRHARKLMRG